MKTCQVCGHVAKDDDKTCPKCGEASWSGKDAARGVSRDVVAVDDKPALDPASFDGVKFPSETKLVATPKKLPRR
jgi:hypothetical protein